MVTRLALAMETKLRSLLKALSYRALGSCVTALVVLFVTNRATLALSVGVLDSAVKIFAYFVHERLWARIPFGRVAPSLAKAQASDTPYPPGSSEPLHALPRALSSGERVG